MYKTYVRSKGFLFLSVIIALGVLAVLNEDVILHGASLTVEHFMVALIVLITLAVGHNFYPLFKEGRYGWAVLCAFVFVSGLFMSVASSAGRLMKTTMTQDLKISRVAESYNEAKQELKSARDRLRDLQARVAKQCEDGLGPRCKGLQAAIPDARADVTLAQERLDHIPVMQPSQPDVKFLANIFGYWSGTEKYWERGLSLIYPLLRSGTLEIACLVCFAMSLGHRYMVIDLTPTATTIEEEPTPLLMGPTSPALLVLQSASRDLTNGELANKLKVSESYASKLATKLVEQGLVEKEQIGREVYLRLKKA